MKKTLKRFYNTAGVHVLCGLLGFIGAVFITPFSGFATALPILPLCAVAAGFIKLDVKEKVLLFALCGGMLRAGYSAVIADIFVFALICGACGALGHYTVKIFASKKHRFWAVVPLGIAVAFQIAFGGNLVSYINAKTLTDNYVNQNYISGDQDIGKLEYHYLSRTWRREIKSLPIPEATGELVVSKKYVMDSYVNQVEQYLMAEQRSDIANVLRKAFPDGSFKVEAEKIFGYPNGRVYISDTADYSDKSVFVVYLGALTDKDGFLYTTSLYRQALEEAGVESVQIIFRGGGHGLYPMEEVYVSSLFEKKQTVKFNCGSVFYPLQRELDKHFGNEQIVYIKGE